MNLYSETFRKLHIFKSILVKVWFPALRLREEQDIIVRYCHILHMEKKTLIGFFKFAFGMVFLGPSW